MIIGSQNLGFLFQNGKQRGILEEVVVGILISLLLALVFDVVIVLIGRVLMPWNRKDRTSSSRGSVPGGPERLAQSRAARAIGGSGAASGGRDR